MSIEIGYEDNGEWQTTLLVNLTKNGNSFILSNCYVNFLYLSIWQLLYWTMAKAIARSVYVDLSRPMYYVHS